MSLDWSLTTFTLRQPEINHMDIESLTVRDIPRCSQTLHHSLFPGTLVELFYGLLLSDGRTITLTVVDGWQRVFSRLHGVADDIVSNTGTKSVAKFCTESCFLLGVSVSLSSRFHSHSNAWALRSGQIRSVTSSDISLVLVGVLHQPIS